MVERHGRVLTAMPIVVCRWKAGPRVNQMDRRHGLRLVCEQAARDSPALLILAPCSTVDA